MRFGIIRLVRKRKSQALNSGLIVLLLVVDPSDLIVCSGVVRLNANSLIEGRQRFRETLEFLVCITQLETCGCMVRLQRQNSLERIDGRAEILEIVVNPSDAVKSRSHRGVESRSL